MRLKLSVVSNQHSEAITGVGWLNAEEVVTVGDDHQLLRINLATSKIEKSRSTLAPLKESQFPTSLHILPSNNASSDTFIIALSNGRVNLTGQSGKVEKSIEAHRGAALAARWANDGSGFLTGGEDGAVKMWSRSGMLRFVLAQNAHPVYAVDWSGDSTKICYCSGEDCFMKMLKAQTNPIKWRAHGGVVLCIRWSSVSDSIATGGEDCRYRLWDSFGRPLFSSSPHGYPVTSLEWNPTGEWFAVGSHNILRLCDKAGWSHALEKPGTGSVYCMSWSSDGTQLVAGCADGRIIHATVIERRVMWENLEAVQSKQRVVDVRDVLTEMGREKLETRDRVHRLQLGFNHLVVATTKQIYTFSAKNWNTPIIYDLKEGGAQSISTIKLCDKFFLIADATPTLKVFNYDGHLQCSIRLPGTTQGDQLREESVAISNDVVALVDPSSASGRSTIHLFDTQSGKSAGDGKIAHMVEVSEIALNQCGSTADRRVAFVDGNDECFLALVNSYGLNRRIARIGTMVSNVTFNSAANTLCAFQNQRLVVWIFPQAVFTDKDMLSLTTVELDGGEDGAKSAFIIGFVGNTITVRRVDGSLATFYVPPFFTGVLQLASLGKLDQALRVCRSTRESSLWATLAAVASSQKNFEVADVCYGQLQEVEKVAMLRQIRCENNQQRKAAMASLFAGGVREAEMALASQPQFSFDAIMVNLMVFKFERALELALKHNSPHLDVVLGYRQRYLERTGRKETDARFLKHLSQVEIDWQHIREKVQAEQGKVGS